MPKIKTECPACHHLFFVNKNDDNNISKTNRNSPTNDYNNVKDKMCSKTCLSPQNENETYNELDFKVTSMPFGKYKKIPFDQIIKTPEGISYLQWMLSNATLYSDTKNAIEEALYSVNSLPTKTITNLVENSMQNIDDTYTQTGFSFHDNSRSMYNTSTKK